MKKDGECCLGDTVALDDGILCGCSRTNWCSLESVARDQERDDKLSLEWPQASSSFEQHTLKGLLLLLWTHRYSLATNGPACCCCCFEQKTNFGNDTGHFFTNLYSLLCLWSTVPSAWSSGNEYYVLRILHKPTLARFNWKTQVSHTNLCNAY